MDGRWPASPDLAPDGGEREALAALYDETSEVVFGTAVAVVHDTELAAELVRQTYVTAWTVTDARPPDGARLCATARSLAVAHVRQMSSSDQLALGATSLERVLQQRSVDWDEAGRPSDARLILALVHRHGCSRGVVAHLLDLTVDEVNRLLVDALRGAA